MSSVEVVLPIGRYTCGRAEAEAFRGSTYLSIVNVGTGTIVSDFGPMDWLAVTVYDENGGWICSRRNPRAREAQAEANATARWLREAEKSMEASR